MNLHALGVQATHHMLDGAVLAGGISGLEHDEHGVGVGSVEAILQRRHLFEDLHMHLLTCDLVEVLGHQTSVKVGIQIYLATRLNPALVDDSTPLFPGQQLRRFSHASSAFPQ